MRKLLTFLFAILFAIPCFADIGATNGVANSATCDSGALDTDSGGAALEAQYTPETINLKWYDEGGTRIATNSCTYDNGITLPSNPTRTGYTFKGWRAIPGTRIEYLESTGTQWIDSGIVPTQTMNFDVGYMYIDGVGQLDIGQVIFGMRNDYDNYKGFLVSSYHYDDNFVNPGSVPNNGYVRLGGEGTGTYSLPQQNNTYVSLKSDTAGYVYFNGSKLSETPLTRIPYGLDLNIYLFRLNAVAPDFAICRIYYLKLYDNTTLVRDFIPIKDPNGVACMYDKVSGQFFYNQGTGNFIAGPEI